MRAQYLSLLPFFGFFFVLLLSWSDLVYAQQGPSWTATPFNPPALPLAVRSPYMSSWLPQGNNPDSIAISWPTFWTDGLPGYDNDTGWWVAVVVDGSMYQIVGYPNVTINNTNQATLNAVEFTATRTSFSLTAGPMDINASFISPIEPMDLVRQSMPFAYFTMSASTNDGATHDLRMYADVALQYITGDNSLIAEWSAFDDGEHIVLSAKLQEPAAFTEISNFAQDAEQHFSFKRISNVTTTWQAGTQDVVVREEMRDMSTQLNNSVNGTFRPVYQNLDWPVLSIESDFGSIEATPEPAVWSIGQTRSPAVQYRNKGGSIEDYYPYYWTVYTNGTYASTAFLDDYSRNAASSSAFDSQIQQAGLNISSDYADLLALASRQALGSIEITVPQTSQGDYNTSDVKVFMKNMGGIGTDAAESKQSVNSVDVMYAAFPVFLYANPELAGYLLAPVLEYMGSNQFTLNYAGMNIGSAYPNATADASNEVHDYGIEESASLIIMTLAYSQRSGNGTFISQYYTLLRQWASYLVDNTLEADEQSADSYISLAATESGQTNLALKGIIGIAAMARIAEIAGVDSDASSFNNTATSYISQWQQKSVSNDSSHVDFLYEQEDTNGLLHNLYADKLLQLGLVPVEVYNVATAYYTNSISQSSYGYGLALDSSDQGVTTIYCMMFAAATSTDYSTQAWMISSIHDYTSSNQNDSPLSTVYSPSSGTPPSSNAGINSPTVGGIFSLLALNTTIQSIEIESVNVGGLSTTQELNSHKGAIAGGVVGSMAAVVLFVTGGLWYLRRRRARLLELERKYGSFVPFAGESSQPPMESIEAPRRLMRLLAPPERGYARWEKAPITDLDSDSSGWESTDVFSTDLRSTEPGSLMPGVPTSDPSWWSALPPTYRLRRALVREHTLLRVEAVQLRREMERMQCSSELGVRSIATSLPRYREPTFQSPRP